MNLLGRFFKRRESTHAVVAPLPTPPPLLHDQGTDNWGLEQAVLDFLEARVTADSVTAETGVGMSTILLARKGCTHYAVTPSEEEIQRVRDACRIDAIDDTNVHFIAGNSQDVLPHLSLPALDLAIIDGGHGMPIPFVDWCYLAPRLKVGGLLVVDDVWLWTGAVLADFMRAEWPWQEVRTFEKAVAFQKTGEQVLDDWGGQPFVTARSRLPTDWPWHCNSLHGHIVALQATLESLERQGHAGPETIENLQFVEGELLDCVRRIEGLCAARGGARERHPRFRRQ